MSVSDRTANTLRRLHSLTGILPIGAFLLFHLFVNSKSVQGHESFNAAAAGINQLPYVVLLELLVIGVPILFHMVLGAVIITTGQMNVGAFRHERNWAYLLQRISGLFLVVFIIYHVWSTRFAAGAEADLYGHMAKALADPGTFVFYVLGVAAAAYHLGNGIFGFSIHWGIAVSRRAQRQMAQVGTAVFLVLTLVGLNALLGFLGRGVSLFERAPETTATVALPAPAAEVTR
jgi:succinate dehydrogenase / fumarate reductase cytochrome b subunit